MSGGIPLIFLHRQIGVADGIIGEPGESYVVGFDAQIYPATVYAHQSDPDLPVTVFKAGVDKGRPASP